MTSESLRYIGLYAAALTLPVLGLKLVDFKNKRFRTDILGVKCVLGLIYRVKHTAR